MNVYKLNIQSFSLEEEQTSKPENKNVCAPPPPPVCAGLRAAAPVACPGSLSCGEWSRVAVSIKRPPTADCLRESSCEAHWAQWRQETPSADTDVGGIERGDGGVDLGTGTQAPLDVAMTAQ